MVTPPKKKQGLPCCHNPNELLGNDGHLLPQGPELGQASLEGSGGQSLPLAQPAGCYQWPCLYQATEVPQGFLNGQGYRKSHFYPPRDPTVLTHE